MTKCDKCGKEFDYPMQIPQIVIQSSTIAFTFNLWPNYVPACPYCQEKLYDGTV
jgi:hypothetical protein